MALGKNYERQDCSFARALELLGERWTLLLVRDAFYGVRRYADFLAHLDIPRAVLAERLRTLTEAGVLSRHRYSDSPPRDEYLLTDRGRELWSVFYPLVQWGERHLSTAGPRRLFAHAACDELLDPTGACRRCGRLAPPEEVEVRPGPGDQSDLRDDPVTEALRRPHRLLEPLL
ncbi:helix-turn-helix transcriptional regulator [Plantactinospora sp. S1510]|uniref:Helix-turn-helix transcriptional regulator n=1 Tax=Plantactinospora alkalitolerans TaxID=2789879 RepID=A0ABS0H2U1_9ACTN|nr:helix-turn-helix domain-containing protein [Plantactinospora alkalitolerans]MBF9132782.1 helix-turn-helix transcriptional regulator [Plantactinospora alkalitolerans]